MTILYVHKTIVTCSKCNEDWIFPRHFSCPSCGDPISILPAEEYDPDTHERTNPTFPGMPQPGPSAGSRGVEPDGFSKKLVYLGLLICAALAGCAYFHEHALDIAMVRLDIPYPIWLPIRFLAYAMAGAGAFYGILSLMFWKSGFHWYRRLKF